MKRLQRSEELGCRARIHSSTRPVNNHDDPDILNNSKMLIVCTSLWAPYDWGGGGNQHSEIANLHIFIMSSMHVIQS